MAEAFTSVRGVPPGFVGDFARVSAMSRVPFARLWTGDPKGWRPNLPFAWGAQPHKGLVYFNDINSGIWITRLPEIKQKPSSE